MIATAARTLHCSRTPYEVEMDDGTRIPTRTIIIAAGAQYRKLDLLTLPHFEGRGVYYAATFVESQLCGDEEVAVVGGGNSAGQAAVYLARTARQVHLLVRSGGLTSTMSRYLVRRIEETPNIALRTHTEIIELSGDAHLEQVAWRARSSPTPETHPVRHVFVMTGAVPNTHWLDRCLALDDRGFIKTGVDLSTSDLATAAWPVARPPYLLESSLPGVFAVGDIRGGNMKRVASAVGEGAIAVAFIHQVLQD
jgi:thioredoxin reductase (NADPH)